MANFDDATWIGKHGEGTMESVTLASTLPLGSNADEGLAEALKILKPGASLSINGLGDSAKSMETTLIFAGFVDVVAGPDGIVGKKPAYENGGLVHLKKSSATASTSKVWKISDDDDDIIDESELLDAKDLAPKVKEDDCELGAGGARKACKNCTCGRAEEEQAQDAQKQQPKSACGNCYLGDAFRCSSCPYRGTAPFKPGERVVVTGE